MLTPYDIQMMEADVRSIIQMWNLRITVLKPLPIDKQPNWNEHMHEYSGKIHYVQFDNVQMERKDQMITNTYTIDIINGAGDQADGMLIFTTSDLNTFIDETCRICYKGEQWRIKNIYPRIGETIIAVFKLTGNDEEWEKIPSIIVDVAQFPPDEEHGDPDLSILDKCYVCDKCGKNIVDCECIPLQYTPKDMCDGCGICAHAMPIGGDLDV